MRNQFALAASVIALAAAPALADMHDQDTAEHDFPVAMEAFMDAYPEITPDTYGLIDTDGDEEVSEEEYNTAVDAGLLATTEPMDAD